ncbi:helix-hairpin-helix domain-containing protein [soil metagenome]
MRPKDVARILSEIAALGELNGLDSFRIRAFQNGARLLEGTEADLSELARTDQLTTLKGIGPGLAGVVRELVLTGRSTMHEELRAATPVGLFDLMRIPGLGTKRIRIIHDELGVDSLDALEAAGQQGKLAALPGFGARTQQQILDGIPFARSSRERRRYPDALRSAVQLLEWLVSQPETVAADIMGPLRRRLEVVDRMDLLVATDQAESLSRRFAELNGITASEVEGDSQGVLEGKLSDGLHVRLRCVAPGEYVSASVRETGSDEHLAELEQRAFAEGLRLDANGLWKGQRRVKLKDEEALYTALRLQYVPPELREGLGEIELASQQAIPELVQVDDLTGTFHCHTTYSDGKATIAEMAEAARLLGWSYLGLADHSRSAGYAGGMRVEQVREQQDEIDALNEGWRQKGGSGSFRIFKGIESDILADGELDYSASVLETFDYVVGSVHSGFRSSREEMTQRIVAAVRNPALTILGHPTGRLLLRREGYPVDVRAVIEAAAENHVIIEINANPNRLDLDWRDVRYAAELGVLIAINPDAHSVPELQNVAFGVNMARKAGLSPTQVLNCWSLQEVEEYLAERKRQR